MKRTITRRDFLQALLIGSGAMLLDMPSPLRAFADTIEGCSGIGDYDLSRGNTDTVIRLLQELEQNRFRDLTDAVVETGEIFDLVVVGGGLSGLSAAHHFMKGTKRKKTCLVLENHPVFGGHAKRNEFLVNGTRLYGAQASNSFVVVDRPDIPGYEAFHELGVPTDFQYQSMDRGLKKLQFDHTNYGFALWHDLSPNVGYFFENAHGKGRWTRDVWEKKFEGSSYKEKARKDLLSWRSARKRYFQGSNYRAWLDSMTYRDYIEQVMGLDPEVARFANPILASGLGLGCDAISAYGAYQISMPGFGGFTGRDRSRRLEEDTWHSFPGGNDGFSRYYLKALIPEAIPGGNSFEEVLNCRLRFDAMDRPGSPVRIRLNSTAVNIRHEGDPDKTGVISIAYKKSGKVFRVRARTVVMAAAGSGNRSVLTDLPNELSEAYWGFRYSAVAVVNVALTNWRFLYDLELTGCRWFSGFGYSCNIRRPMIVGDYRPALHPDKPIVLTFYVPYHYPGLPPKEQGDRGRAEMLSTSFADFENRIRTQMSVLFKDAGFDHTKDIAGIIVNRWINAYVNPLPGFYFGKNGKTAEREIIRKGYGRIAIGHSELDGHQNWAGAVGEGKRAALQAVSLL